MLLNCCKEYQAFMVNQTKYFKITIRYLSFKLYINSINRHLQQYFV